MPRPGGRSLLAAALVSAAACGGDTTGVAPCVYPEVMSSSIAANADNVLSALVATRVRGADSVRVRFSRGGVSPAELSPSTLVNASGDSTVLPLLGLRAMTDYSATVVAYAECGSTDGPAMQITTGPLPADMPSYTASGRDPAPGYVVFSAGPYGLAIDNTGRVVWYHRFAQGVGLNFQAQPNGRYIIRSPVSGQPASSAIIEIDALGKVTRTMGCLNGLQARPHDFIAGEDGSYWVMCDELRTLDLSSTKGPPAAQVSGTVVQHISSSGTMLFQWSAFDHFTVDYSAIDAVDRAGSTINWTHGNAIDLDSAGNLLVSFRNLNEITKIDTRTGAVIWRMGGRDNQFVLADGLAPRFVHQHGLRAAGKNAVTLLDNLGDAAGSRAQRFEIDDAARTARLTATYSAGSGVVAQIGGTTQSLPGGRTLVSFGNGGRVEEFDAAGSSVWRIDGNPGYIFRAQRITSLYRPGAGTTR